MNQQLSNELELTEDGKKLYQELDNARREYQELSYKGQLQLLQPKKKHPWIPLSLAASVVAVTVLVISFQSSHFVKPKITISKIDISTNFPSGLNRSPKLNNKKISLFAHKPKVSSKFKTKFSMPIRPSRQST